MHFILILVPRIQCFFFFSVVNPVLSSSLLLVFALSSKLKTITDGNENINERNVIQVNGCFVMRVGIYKNLKCCHLLMPLLPLFFFLTNNYLLFSFFTHLLRMLPSSPMGNMKSLSRR